MPRITQIQIDSLPDPLLSSEYSFNLGRIPGGGITSDLTLKCKSVSRDGASIEMQENGLHGFMPYAPGRKTFPRTLSVTYMEDRLNASTNKLMLWLEEIRGTISGTSSGYVDDLSVTATLNTYDNTGALINTVRYLKLMIQEVSPQTFASDGAILDVAATFKYSRLESDAVTLR